MKTRKCKLTKLSLDPDELCFRVELWEGGFNNSLTCTALEATMIIRELEKALFTVTKSRQVRQAQRRARIEVMEKAKAGSQDAAS